MSEPLRIIILVLAGACGTIGFSFSAGLEKKLFPLSAIAAAISCLVYEFVFMELRNLILAALLASAAVAVYAYFIACFCKIPATIMIIAGIIPLVPGGKLYYAMLGAVRSDMAAFSMYAKQALIIAAGIAIGIIAATAISRTVIARYKGLILSLQQKNNR